MSRWHHSSCASPLVVVEQNQPTCKSCGNLPDVDALIKAQTTSSSIPDLPPDEPHGQYNLWWPPSITYVTEAPDGTRTRVTPPDEKNSATASGNTKTSPSHQNVIYPASLKSNEFRVLLMSPVDDVDYPVHVDLEKCHDDGHSEYETASYTWGGEDRDITPCKPLFIGPYWDVLLQTRNCWELLRHLRPRRGLRTVWVDAICIDQSDLKEREAQVAKMGRIYRNALRVVLYLGPDLAPPTSSSSTYPIRHDLYGFDSLKENTKSRSFRSASDPLLLSKVFQREYFRRVWIVQELVLSRLITFRVGDVEFMVDSGQLFDEENEINIENAIIPWFKFATKRSVKGLRGRDLETAVDLSRNSSASDPRDKIFGVLGLSRRSDIALVPIYSISFLHLQFGYFAYCLLVNRDVRVLDLAAVSKRRLTPSWAPSLSSSTMQSQLSIAELTSVRTNDNTPTPIPGNGLTCVEHIANPNRELWVPDGYVGYHRWIYDCVRLVSWLDPDPTRVHRYNKMHSIDVCAPQNYDNRCYHFGASLNAESGALHILAIHVLSLDQMRTGKIRRLQDGSWYIYTIRFSSDARADDPDSNWSERGEKSADALHEDETVVHLRTNVSDLEDLICMGGIGLFALYEGPSTVQQHVSGESIPRLCLLRRTREESLREFELVAASVDICFHLPFTDSGKRKFESADDFFERTRATPIGFAHNEDQYDQYRAINTIKARREYSFVIATWDAVLEGFPNDLDLRSHQMDGVEFRDFPHDLELWPQLRTYENLPATRYLTMERLRVSRFDLLNTLKQRWVTAEGQTEAGMPAGNIPYFVPLCGSFPWPLFAFPNVSRSRTMFAWFQEVAKHTAITDYLETYDESMAESPDRQDFDGTDFKAKDRRYRRQQDCIDEAGSKFEEGSSALLKSYLDIVSDFRPRTVTTKLEPHNVTLVELAFHPEQHHFLKSITEVISIAKSQEGRGAGAYDDFLYFHLRWKRRPNELDELADLKKSNDHGCKGFDILKAIGQHAGETLWITFDWITLECWALSHEFIGDWKDLKHYCKEGEDAMDLIEKGPKEKDRDIQAPRWPREFVERLGIDGSTWEVTIV